MSPPAPGKSQDGPSRDAAVAWNSEGAVPSGGTMEGRRDPARARARRGWRASPRARGSRVWSSCTRQNPCSAGAGPDASLHVSALNLVICSGGLRGLWFLHFQGSPAICFYYGSLWHSVPQPPEPALARAGGCGASRTARRRWGPLSVSPPSAARSGIREGFYSSFYGDER